MMSDAKPVKKWEDMLKEATTKGAKGPVTSAMTHGIAVVGIAALGMAMYPAGGKAATHSSFLDVIHLGAVGTNFGTTLWVSFIAGIIMVRTLPRHMFGHLQSRLFPAFFHVGLATNIMSLATYLFIHPRGSWESSEKIQMLLMGTSLACSAIGAYVITPWSIHAMWEMYQEEQSINDGGMLVGSQYPKKDEHPEFARLHRRFAKWHGISMLMNLIGFITTGAHLWNLATCLRM